MKSISVTSNISTRVDRYLKRLFPSLTQGLIEKFIRNNNIKINNKKCKSSTHVMLDDVINLWSDHEAFQVTAEDIAGDQAFSFQIKTLGEEILSKYKISEFENFIAINKPCNLATQGGSGISRSVDHGLKYLNYQYNMQLKIVHRLDYPTSGLLLIAKNIPGANILTQAFREGKVNKIYIAILVNTPKTQNGMLKSYIIKTRVDGKYISVESDDMMAKEAITEYQIIATNDKYSLCIFKPKTGRMHQLRHHANLLDTYILGDQLYGLNLGKDSSNEYLNSRLMLHALSVSIGLNDDEFYIEAELSQVFKKVIKQMFNMNEIHFTINGIDKVLSI